MHPFLEAKGITKRFGKFVANDSVSLEVQKGTVHAIIGENGAGKSTLMNVLSGIYQPDEGAIYLNGEHKTFHNAAEAAAAGVGMVYQEFMVFPGLSVLDNIMMGYEKKTALGAIDKKATQAAVEDICKTYGFQLPLHMLASQVPVSVLQQVEIVKVLYRGAELLIFDEPTAVLTPQGIKGLFDAMRFLLSKGKTIIFITHKLNEVMEIANSITVLKDGKVVGTTTPDKSTKDDLAGMMVGRDVLLRVEKHPKPLGAPVLEIRGLSVRDENQRLKVKQVGLTVHAGEIVGIAGVSGSGQVELVEAIFGLHNHQAESMTLCGHDMRMLDCRARRCLGIGYVPQDRMVDGTNPKASIWENTMMGYHIAHGFSSKILVDHKQANRFAKQVVEEFRVKTASIDSPIRSLSGGNIQKVMVGREFLQENKLLILEDPTRGIDIGAIEFIWGKIQQIADSGVAVLLVSQELSEVIELSDHLYVMYSGELFDGGAHGELNEQQIGLLMTGGSSHA